MMKKRMKQPNDDAGHGEPSVGDARYLGETRAWVRRAVIGLNLCPFAKAPEAKGRVRYVLSRAHSPDALMARLDDEMQSLVVASETQIETTLVIHPFVLTDFLEFNDFAGEVEDRIDAAGLEGVLQLATFHPRYRFAGTADDDLGNATNRSPYPTLQLLRESSIDRAVIAFPNPEAIYKANIATLGRLGAVGWGAIERACREDPTGEAG